MIAIRDVRDLLLDDDAAEPCEWCSVLVLHPAEQLQDAEKLFGGLHCGFICADCVAGERAERRAELAEHENEEDECACRGGCTRCLGLQ